MEDNYAVYILYLIIIWALSKWLIIFIAHGNKNIPADKQEQNYKAWNTIRHVVFGFILIIFIINLINQ